MLQGPTASLGIYIDSGSVYESSENTGASNLLEYMAFKATPHRSSFRVVREVILNSHHNFTSIVVLTSGRKEQQGLVGRTCGKK